MGIKSFDLNGLYVEIENDVDKIPLLILHGGPGAPLTIKKYRVLFPKDDFGRFALITFHQRGCGKSKVIDLKYNKTQYIIKDIHNLKQYLGIDQWCVFGASWGATLAMLYSSIHPNDVRGLFIHGLSLFDECIESSSKAIGYDYYREFIEFPNNHRNLTDCQVLKWYHSQIKQGNQKAIDQWCDFEDKCMLTFPNITKSSSKMTTKQKHDIALLESYYYLNKAFMDVTKYMKQLHNVKFPIFITHGRFDAVCSLSNALKFKQNVPHAKLIITNHGHSSFNIENANAIRDALVHYLNKTR